MHDVEVLSWLALQVISSLCVVWTQLGGLVLALGLEDRDAYLLGVFLATCVVLVTLLWCVLFFPSLVLEQSETVTVSLGVSLAVGRNEFRFVLLVLHSFTEIVSLLCLQSDRPNTIG